MIVEVNKEAIAEAARILRAGGLAAFPTETVYGLGADATNGTGGSAHLRGQAPAALQSADRACCEPEAARDLVQFNGGALALAEKFWPGPLTLVLPCAEAAHPVSALVTAGLDTLAVRVRPTRPPAH